jgi:hypothetical protein
MKPSTIDYENRQRFLASQNRKLMRATLQREELHIRYLLEHWVSELNPAVVRGPNNEILGLCDADAQLGSTPYIFNGRLDL